MRDLWKLKHSLYTDWDYEGLSEYKCENTDILFARKGQIAERHELTEELREEFCEWDEQWKTIYIFKNMNYLLSREEYSDDFEPVKRRRKNNG